MKFIFFSSHLYKIQLLLGAALSVHGTPRVTIQELHQSDRVAARRRDQGVFVNYHLDLLKSKEIQKQNALCPSMYTADPFLTQVSKPY